MNATKIKATVTKSNIVTSFWDKKVGMKATILLYNWHKG